MKRILITGDGGQLAFELERSLPDNIEAEFLSSAELDITRPEDVAYTVSAYEPDWVINTAAFTAVDNAEDEPDKAMQVNTLGVKNMARAAADCGASMVQVSTDYVFDGAASEPYPVGAETAPLNVYGKTKLAGDLEALAILDGQTLVVRTSWVYSSHGHNFVKSILRLCAEREQLSVVSDQIGTPTWANTLANMIWSSIGNNLSGIRHWTDAGVASWYDFAVAIQDIGFELGLLEHEIPIYPISSTDYPQKALRPKYSVLNKEKIGDEVGLEPMYWRHALKKMMMEIRDNA